MVYRRSRLKDGASGQCNWSAAEATGESKTERGGPSADGVVQIDCWAAAGGDWEWERRLEVGGTKKRESKRGRWLCGITRM